MERVLSVSLTRMDAAVLVIVDTGTLTISLPFSGVGGDIYEFRDAQRVELRRKNNFNLQLGIYCCDIPTVAVHHYTDISVRDKPVYIYGVYDDNGGITVSLVK
jgi:hypothetical protein